MWRKCVIFFPKKIPVYRSHNLQGPFFFSFLFGRHDESKFRQNQKHWDLVGNNIFLSRIVHVDLVGNMLLSRSASGPGPNNNKYLAF